MSRNSKSNAGAGAPAYKLRASAAGWHCWLAQQWFRVASAAGWHCWLAQQWFRVAGAIRARTAIGERSRCPGLLAKFRPRNTASRKAVAQSRSRHDRRGVLLLVVLGLLTIFTLLCITFVMVARQNAAGSRAAGRIEQYEDPPEVLLNTALLQAIVGTTNRRSVLGPHSIFEDIYGSDGLRGQATSNAMNFDSGGQMLRFQIMADAGFTLENTINDYYNGRVLTMLSGTAAGQSTRITGYVAAVANPTLRVLAFENGAVPVTNDRFLINGRPFNGTGFGYEPATIVSPLLNASDGDPAHRDPSGMPWEYALLPNPVFFQASANYDDPAGLGGADEDYDIPDFQNMLLAMQVSQPTDLGAPPRDPLVLIPSLHRPALVNYWFKRMTAAPSTITPEEFQNADLAPDQATRERILALKRRIILRPLPEDHPNFTGSNPSANSIFFLHDTDGDGMLDDAMAPPPGNIQPWDVDNNGDGQPDSIWVDIGLPVQTAADGRQYKPLVAYLVLDLDGRLNLNAHGGPVDLATHPDVDPTDQDVDGLDLFDGPWAGQPNSPARLPRGLGFGTADISLTSLLTPLEIEELTQGGAVEGRYGEIHLGTGVARPGVSGTGTNDLASRIKHFATPRDYWAFQISPFTALTEWGSPADMHGLTAVGLDLRGQPYYGYRDAISPHQGALTNQRLDNLYELDLSRAGPRGWTDDPTSGESYRLDAPFAPSEMESMLRFYDLDASVLPTRLPALLPRFFDPTPPNAGADLRHLVTTDSWDLPVPSGALPADVAAAASIAVGNRTIVDLLGRKLRTFNAGITDVQIRQNIKDLLAPELIAGLRLDINRPLGNGYDDNGNGVVDEPLEALAELAWNDPSGVNNFNDPSGTRFVAPFDADNDGQIGFGGTLARHLLARHLYVAMMLLSREPILDRPQHARRIAQWAINVVDFRDRDSIMTPFEYDEEPFDDDPGSMDGITWDVDGIIGQGSPDDMLPERKVVWGCERPELLITETLAFHDRHTQDLLDPDQTTNSNPPDLDFDQKNMPEGSLFVELYNPWGDSEAPAGELHEPHPDSLLDPLDNRTGVALQKLSGVAKNPVWRLAITVDPRPPEDQDGIPLANRIERTAYFADASGITGDGSSQKHWSQNRPAATAPVVRPGHYAVIGRGPPRPTFVGRGSPKTIRLSPRVSVSDNAGNESPYDEVGLAIKPIEYIEMDRPMVTVSEAQVPLRFSISEPYGGYPDPGVAGMGNYSPPLDEPFDAFRSNMGTDPLWGALWKDGTTDSPVPFRTIHLQRLANPLVDWNPERNPYLTIDSMAVNLTIYNTQIETYEDPSTTGGPPMRFDSRQRFGAPVNVWVQTAEPPDAGKELTPIPKQTLGFLNRGFGPRWIERDFNLLFSDPIIRQRYMQRYVGDPIYNFAFPWLTWNNRPFASHLELMLVPDKAQWELLYFDPTRNPPNGFEHFTLDGTGTTLRNRYNAEPLNPLNPAPFEHLLNFFESDDSGVEKAAQWHRILDYVHVPSRFVGTETVLDPGGFGAGSFVNNLGDLHPYYAPFNRVSRYRDPGRVNINTIFDRRVWDGVAAGLSGLAGNTFWQTLAKSRRGYPDDPMRTFGPTSAGLVLNEDYPTFFANPFRAAAGSDLVPIADMKKTLPEPATDRLEIDVTLLRRDPTPSGAVDEPLFTLNMSEPYRNANRNPYFRYQAFTKLGNMVTTRSNVYAIWVTVGYFEVTPGPIDDGHPDGYRLGRELGVDSGEINRYRAFAIVDRTIPVGFERGKNHNVEKAILVKRIIE